jgi:hypothetical protein
MIKEARSKKCGCDRPHGKEGEENSTEDGFLDLIY